MITSQSTASNASVRYLIAQYTRDPFRKEPSNVGVIVDKGGSLTARFVAEDEPGSWNQSRLRRFDNPNAYRLWVDHWRKTMSQPAEHTLGVLMTQGSQSFTLVAGGEITDTGSDSPQEVCEFLFNLLVSSGGLKTATEPSDQLPNVLKNEVATRFREEGIMATTRPTNPITSPDQLRGASNKWRTVTFVQRTSDACWAMEPIDFRVSRPSRMRDHAAYVKLIFDDIVAAENGSRIHTVSLVRMNDDAVEDAVAEGMEFLRESSRIVRWDVESEQREFLGERVHIAMSS